MNRAAGRMSVFGARDHLPLPSREHRERRFALPLWPVRAKRRLAALVVGTPVLVVLVAMVYRAGMAGLEGEVRSLADSVLWAAETLTTTGYGRDNHWSHPVMVALVVLVQFTGVGLTFMAFSLVIVPFFEQRFEGRLPRTAPKQRDYILIYRYGPAVASLLHELKRAKQAYVLLEEDDATGRRLLDRGEPVVVSNTEEHETDPALFQRARALVANGTDQQNAALVLTARQLGFRGEIVALVERQLHRKPILLAGADSAYTPLHALAAAMAGLAGERIPPRLAGLGMLSDALRSAELRVDGSSVLAGMTLAQTDIRAQTGATIIGLWRGGDFVAHPPASTMIDPGTILMAVGSPAAIDRLSALATPLPRRGPTIICGHGEVGTKVAELMRDAGESIVVIDLTMHEGVDIQGDALDQSVLQRADIQHARAVVLAMSDDSATLFAASVVRDVAPDVPIIARVDRAQNVERIHRAGADFALSLSQVAGELLAQRILGQEWVSLEARAKLVRAQAGALIGQNPVSARIGRQTGCSVVAVQRGEEIVVEFSPSFRIEEGDMLHVCGPEPELERFFDVFPSCRLS